MRLIGATKLPTGRELLDMYLEDQARPDAQNLSSSTVSLMRDVNAKIDSAVIDRKLLEASRVDDAQVRDARVRSVLEETRRRYNSLLEIAKVEGVDALRVLDKWGEQKKSKGFMARYCPRPIYPCWREGSAA
jgi:hypothetical protein